MYYENPKGVAVHDGFPNAATDTSLQNLDLNKLLVKNSISTYFMRAQGNDWHEYGILRGDLLVIDRAQPAGKNDLVVWQDNDSFRLSPKHTVSPDYIVWGTLTGVVRSLSGVAQ